MELIIKLELEDINTCEIGINFQIETIGGIKIIFSDEAIKELILDYKKVKD